MFEEIRETEYSLSSPMIVRSPYCFEALYFANKLVLAHTTIGQ